MHIHGFRLILIASLVQSLAEHCWCTNSSFFGCFERERRALLKFKQSFSFPSQRLSSWQGEHCCEWLGVECDAITGRVTKLDLRFVEAFERQNFTRRLHARSEVDSSLKNLEELRYLDLRGNDFGRVNIPGFFGSMTRLRFLGLSQANFTGSIPHELGNLTELRALHLMSDFGGLRANSLDWASNLGSLRHLDLSNVNLTKVGNLAMKVLSKLPSLSHLSLAGCELGNAPFARLEYLKNMTSLRLLDLSRNSINFSIPPFVRSFETLFHLDLSSNGFDIFGSGGLFSILDNACSLKSLDLSGNPTSLTKYSESYGGNLYFCAKYDLEYLDLSMSDLSGPFPDWFEKLESLKHLDLRLNSFFGPITSSIGFLSSLAELDLSYNQLNGSIPEKLGDLSSLSDLNLSNNNLSGDVPKSLGKLRNLEVLDVTQNSLEGYVSDLHLANLSKLRTLDLSFNLNLILETRSILIPSFQLHYIDMTSCKFGSRFPRWLRTQKEVIGLSLSDGDIRENFPNWLCGMRNLAWLDLSRNRIIGSIPTNFFASTPNLIHLNLRSNLINGSIPKSLCKNEKLISLDLSRNSLSGEIPDCWESDRLGLINLSGNKLSGNIPISIGNLPKLLGFSVNKNELTGELPSSFEKCASLRVLDVGDNEFRGVIPNLTPFMEILRLTNNSFAGKIPPELCRLSFMRILDLANNFLSGEIPRCFNNLTGMTKERESQLGTFGVFEDGIVEGVMKGRELEYENDAFLLVSYLDLSRNDLHGLVPDELCDLSELNGLNLSYNHFSGEIPTGIGNLESLESLDLSHNNFSGVIPATIASLTKLAFLNMSFNNLSGQVPSGNQLQTLEVDPSIFAGNPLLCGPTLPKKCSVVDDHDDDEDEEEKEEEDESGEKIWLGFSIAVGYATGLWTVIGILFFNRNWRIAYFRFAENAKDWVVLMVRLHFTRLCSNRD